MKLVFWRICRARRVKSAFDGEGARRNPGRWNHRDVPMVYCASSLSLATLEYFVHCDPDDLPANLVSIRAELPAGAPIERLEASALPSEWRDYPSPDILKDLGSEWAASLRTVALIVPSAITPIEANILLNPRHRAIKRLTIHAPEPFAFDPRLGR